MKLTAKDAKIISSLRRNGRERLTRLSRKTGIPVSTIFDRLRHHEGKLITKHTILIDFEKLGFTARAQVILRVAQEDKEELKEFLIKKRMVNSLFKINNGYDFLFEVIGKDMKDLEYFLQELEINFKIMDKQAFYIIDELKQEELFTHEKDVDQVTNQKKQ